MKSLEIVFIDDNATLAPIYCKYANQYNPQRAYIELKPYANTVLPRLEIGFNPNTGNAVPNDVYKRTVLRWPIASNTSRDSIEALQHNTDLAECLAKIITDYSYDPYVGGIYTQGAEKAIEQVERILEKNLDQINVWSADEWIGESTIDLVELIQAGSLEDYASLCQPQELDVVVCGSLSNAVASQLENYLSCIDEEDRSETERQAAIILQRYQAK